MIRLRGNSAIFLVQQLVYLTTKELLVIYLSYLYVSSDDIFWAALSWQKKKKKIEAQKEARYKMEAALII